VRAGAGRARSRENWDVDLNPAIDGLGMNAADERPKVLNHVFRHVDDQQDLPVLKALPA
jgi:hypothetical protein